MINIIVKRPALSPPLKWLCVSLAPTWGQDASNSQNYNRYAYCLNNPLKYTDPTGNNWEDRMQNGLARVTNPLRKFGDSFDRFQNNITGQSSTYSTVASGGLSAGSVAYSSAGQQMATGRKGGFTDASGRFISNQTLVAESHAHCKKRDLMKDLLIYKFQVNKEGEILNLANATVYGYRSDKLYDFLAGQGHAIEQYVNLNNDAQSSGGGWDAANTTLNAFGFASGIKETIIEGGAALNRGINISKVNDVSLLRTYGASGAKYLKISKGLGIAGSIVTTGYSLSKVYDQYNAPGGLNNVLNHRDVLDAGVGMAGIGAFFFLSNPVGWGIGAGVLIYGGATMIYDAYNDKK